MGSLFFRSPSMIYISQQQLVNITQILSDKINASNASTPLSFSSCLLFFSGCYCSDWRDECECSLFLLLWLPRRDFLLVWIKKDFWQQQDLNPQPSNLIHDELDHRTTVFRPLTLTLFVFSYPLTFCYLQFCPQLVNLLSFLTLIMGFWLVCKYWRILRVMITI